MPQPQSSSGRGDGGMRRMRFARYKPARARTSTASWKTGRAESGQFVPTSLGGAASGPALDHRRHQREAAGQVFAMPELPPCAFVPLSVGHGQARYK
jgi:hypothetical protein